MSATTKKPWTADELHRLPAGRRYEIDEGELVIMAPAGWRHVEIQGRVARLLGDHVERDRLGSVGAGEAGFRLRGHPEPDAAVEEPVLPGSSCRLRELFGEG